MIKANQTKQLSARPPVLSTSQKRRRRRAANINRLSRQMGDQVINTNETWGPTPMVPSMSTSVSMRRLAKLDSTRLTPEGVAFLKCAFAPPDFQNSGVSGVPDQYRGNSLVQRHRNITQFTFLAGNDYWFALIPSPGISNYQFAAVTGTDFGAGQILSANYYPDYDTIFGPSATYSANLTSRYRLISNHIEFIPTVNQMTWSGQIQVWKIPVQIIVRPDPTSGSLLTVTGLQGLSNSSQGYSNQYTGPFINGVYAAAYNTNSDFEFNSTLENASLIPSVATSPPDYGGITGAKGIPGIDQNFETIVIKVSGITANQTAMLKTWQCVEYQFNPTTSLYGFMSISPYDLAAIEMYRAIILGLPVAVPFYDNADFWKRVLTLINQISGYVAIAPGPIGLAARGVNLLTRAGLPYV